MQYTSLPDGFTIQELDASHLEQFNALLRYAFQVTEEELVQVGWQEDDAVNDVLDRVTLAMLAEVSRQRGNPECVL